MTKPRRKSPSPSSERTIGVLMLALPPVVLILLGIILAVINEAIAMQSTATPQGALGVLGAVFLAGAAVAGDNNADGADSCNLAGKATTQAQTP